MNRNNYPRVTKIIDAMFPFNEESFKAWAHSQGLNPEWITSESKRIGSKIHEWIQNRFEQIEWADLPPISKKEEGYLEAVESILEDYEILKSEVEVFNDEWKYRGTLDAIARLRNTDEVMILDWKSWGAWDGNYKRSRDKIKKLEIQLSMYKEALGEPYPTKGIILKSDGTYEVEDIKDNDMWKKWMKEHKLT